LTLYQPADILVTVWHRHLSLKSMWFGQY